MRRRNKKKIQTHSGSFIRENFEGVIHYMGVRKNEAAAITRATKSIVLKRVLGDRRGVISLGVFNPLRGWWWW